MTRYLMTSELDGERYPDEEVDQEFVDRFISKETLDWFRELGGTETLTKMSGGVLYNVSTSPDGKNVRKTVFTPIRSKA